MTYISPACLHLHRAFFALSHDAPLSPQRVHHLSRNLVSYTSSLNPWLATHKRLRLRPRPYRLVMSRSRWFTNPLKELLGSVRAHLAKWYHSYRVLRYSVISSPHMLKIWTWVWSILVLSRVSVCRFQNFKLHIICTWPRASDTEEASYQERCLGRIPVAG